MSSEYQTMSGILNFVPSVEELIEYLFRNLFKNISEISRCDLLKLVSIIKEEEKYMIPYIGNLFLDGETEAIVEPENDKAYKQATLFIENVVKDIDIEIAPYRRNSNVRNFPLIHPAVTTLSQIHNEFLDAVRSYFVDLIYYSETVIENHLGYNYDDYFNTDIFNDISLNNVKKVGHIVCKLLELFENIVNVHNEIQRKKEVFNDVIFQWYIDTIIPNSIPRPHKEGILQFETQKLPMYESWSCVWNQNILPYKSVKVGIREHPGVKVFALEEKMILGYYRSKSTVKREYSVYLDYDMAHRIYYAMPLVPLTA